MDAFEEFMKKGRNYNGGKLEFFEDTHDSKGNYRPHPQGAVLSSHNKAPVYPSYSTFEQWRNGAVYHNHASPNVGNVHHSTNNMSYGVQSAMPNMGQSMHNTTQPSVDMPLPVNNEVVKRTYQNFVIYRPTNSQEVEHLIAYLKRREPALVNLDNVDSVNAQRVLDFVAGAVFALNGSIQQVSSNSYLVCPEGVQITAEMNKDKSVR